MAHRGNVSTQASSSFLHLARSFNLTQMVKEPTHGMNILDILLTSEPSIIAGPRTLPPCSTSDRRRLKSKLLMHPLCSRNNCESIVKSLREIDWIGLINFCSSTNAIYKRLIKRYVPVSRRKDTCKGYSKRIRYLKAKADYFYSSSLSVRQSEYKRYSVELRKALVRRQMLKENDLASSKNTKRFFSYCRKNLKLADSIPNLISQGVV
ncbi:hypothetical protein COOONC_10204, partial [Cooperia oncophora]